MTSLARLVSIVSVMTPVIESPLSQPPSNWNVATIFHHDANNPPRVPPLAPFEVESHSSISSAQ